MQTPEHLFLTKKKSSNIKKPTTITHTHTQANPSGGAGRTAHTIPLSKAAQAAPDPSARPKSVPESCVAPLHASGTGLGVAGEERTPGPTLFWCLGILAPVPRHQVPEGTTKSTLATAKRGPKGWGPSTALASQAAPRQEGAPGTKAPLPPESLASLPRTTVRGRKGASAEPSQPERGWNCTARDPLGSRRLGTRESSSSPPTVPTALSGPEEGARSHGSGKKHGFQPARGVCDAGPPAGKTSPAFQLHLWFTFIFQNPGK